MCKTAKDALGRAQEPRELPCQQCFTRDFCAALDSSALPIYIIDPQDFRVLYSNDALRRYLGGDPTGQLCYQCIRGNPAPCESCSAMRLYRDGDGSPKEFRHSSGVWALLQASLLRWRGRDVVKLTCVDITRQKHMEEELRLRTQEYAAVVRQSGLGIIRYDIAEDTARLNVDQNLDRVEERTIPAFSQYLVDSGRVSPESRDTLRTILDDLRRGEEGRDYDLCLTLARGEQRWYRLNYILVRNEQGHPFRAVISFFDNTEQRERELTYNRWRTRLAALMDEKTACLEVNLTQDLIEEGDLHAWGGNLAGKGYSALIASASKSHIFLEDLQHFRAFFDRERLLGLFGAGRREDMLEYRAMVEGEPCWNRAELQLVAAPSTGEVKAVIIFRNVDADMRERQRLKDEAERDSMTGLYNRATTERLIRQALAEKPGSRCCLLAIDLDDLRGINSSLGHPEGDRALKAIARAMTEQFRRSDILGRIGGDEFLVLLRNVPEADGLRSPISGFMRRLRAISIGPMKDRPIHVSMGCAMGTAGQEDFKTLYRQADLALYYTKSTGKNDYNFYVPEMEKRDFLYQPRSTVTMTRPDWYETQEFKKLLRAMSAFFPLVISVNLTQNTYYMMEYMAYTTQEAKDEGCFDDLIAGAAEYFHPEDRQSFLDSFRRENLLEAYAQGKSIVGHKGRQLGDDGVYRMARTVVVFMEDEVTGDICEITFAHVTPPETEDLV